MDITTIATENIIKLNKNEGGSPIFCLHPMGGNVLCYYKLARLLEDKYAVYGIQFPKITAGKAPFNSISEMSKYYIEQLKKFKPTGPYALLGWSMGGFTAFEMARQLTLTGEKVSILALVDAGNSAVVPHMENADPNTLFKYLIGIMTYNLSYTNKHTLPFRIRFLIFMLNHLGLSFRYVTFLLPLFLFKKYRVNFADINKYLEMIKADFSSTERCHLPIEEIEQFLKENNLSFANVQNLSLSEIYQNCRYNVYAMQHAELQDYNKKVIFFSTTKHESTDYLEKHCLDIEKISLHADHYSILKDTQSLEIISRTLKQINI